MDTPETGRCADIERLLTPYVDGEAGERERAAVDRHMAVCAPCATRLEAERRGRAVLHERRHALRTPAPAGLRARCTPAPRARHAVSWVPLSLAASLLLALAGAVAFTIAEPVEALAASVAADHIKCFKLQDMSATADAAVLSQQWRDAQGWELPVPPGQPEEGIRLVGMRRCLSTAGRMAHLLYTVDGHPVSVFVWKEAGAGRHTVEILGQRGVIWSNREHRFAVVGSVDDAVLSRMAGHVRQAAE